MDVKLNFVISAYNTTQNMIKFSDEKASIIFIFYGITLSLLGTKSEKIFSLFRNPGGSKLIALVLIILLLSYLLSMIYSLYYALRTVTPTLSPDIERRGTKKIYWSLDVLKITPEQYLTQIEEMRNEDVLKEMVYELYTVSTILGLKFMRINRCTRGAMWSLSCWVVIAVFVFFL